MGEYTEWDMRKSLRRMLVLTLSLYATILLLEETKTFSGQLVHKYIAESKEVGKQYHA